MMWLSSIVLLASVYCINGVSRSARSFRQQPCMQGEMAGGNCCPGLLLDNNGNCVLPSECPNYGQFATDSLDRELSGGVNPPVNFEAGAEGYDMKSIRNWRQQNLNQLSRDFLERISTGSRQNANPTNWKNPDLPGQNWNSVSQHSPISIALRSRSPGATRSNPSGKYSGRDSIIQ